jgi:acyl CoA:acetate/3-ketoacid CoA transferase alpha subunit
MSSLASAVQRSQIANDLAIVNAHRTDEDGTIKFITDGERLWVRN